MVPVKSESGLGSPMLMLYVDGPKTWTSMGKRPHWAVGAQFRDTVVAVGLALMMDADMSVRGLPSGVSPPIQGMGIVVEALF